MDTIRVAIADDHKIFRKGVILSLRPYTNIKFVQEAENGEALLNGLAESQPDVVLMDLRMPGKDGIEATKTISKQNPQIKVLVLSMYEDERFVFHMMENGANGYLLKNSEPQEIRRAIMDVHEKGYYLNNYVNRILLKRSHARNKSTPSLNSEITLTDKEKDVLRFRDKSLSACFLCLARSRTQPAFPGIVSWEPVPDWLLARRFLSYIGSQSK